MHLPNRPSGLKDISAHLDASLFRLQTELELDDVQWREVLGLSTLDFRKYSEKRMELPFTALHQVAEHFQLSVEAIVRNEIDYPTLISHLRGDLATLPDKFLFMARTRRRVLSQLLDFVEDRLGSSYRKTILRRFQLTEACLADPDALVNATLMIEVARLMRRAGVSEAQFHGIGSEAFQSMIGSGLERDFLGLKAHRVYSKLIENFGTYFGTNCNYRILKASAHSLVVESLESPEILEAFKLKRFDCPELCAFKSGIFRVAPALAALPYSDVVETHCTHRGDPACHFKVSFREPMRAVVTL